MPGRLRDADIAADTKAVKFVESFRNPLDLNEDSPQFDAFRSILKCISNGTPLPEKFYRANRHSTPDGLLEKRGIMHLHLGDPSTNELLFLIQYPKYVALLEINNHMHFATNPVGDVLHRLHSSKVALLAQQVEIEKLERTATIKAGIKPRSQ